MKVLLGVTGSVGSKLTQKIIDEFELRGHDVQCIGTENSLQFTNIPYVQKDEFLRYKEDGSVRHIELAKWADVYLICPCTSNTFHKILNGISDNIVLTTLRAFDNKNKKVYIAPVMNTQMLLKDIELIQSERQLNEHVSIIWPTTKKLACGEYGLGAMSNIVDIVRCVEGHRWSIPDWFMSPGLFNYNTRDDSYSIDKIVEHPGWFGYQRKYDIHTGVDLYCDKYSVVYPFEDGKVANIGKFTGESVGCGWWYDSEFISISGNSGVIIYGEISVDKRVKIGDMVSTKTIIGNTVRILKKEPKSFIIGHSMDMLHVELMEDKHIECALDWKKGNERQKELKDPSIYIAIANKKEKQQ